ncbi:MAG TPA: replication-relaxation family protein [Candidatus Saccharimonadales bacterium]|nr:replication-relaxation family protein [Candidatus Saccharimonadales bacterium]
MSRKLTDNQINTLQIVFRFRFVTARNLADTQHIDRSTAFTTLEKLYRQGYLGKHYDSSYHLTHKHAKYYLTEQTINMLRTLSESGIPTHIWKNRIRDKSRSNEFIEHQVALHAAYNAVHTKLAPNAAIQLAFERTDRDNIVTPPPDLIITPNEGTPFFVDITDDQPLFLVKKRIRRYIRHFDDGEWDWVSYPTVNLVRTSSSVERTNLRTYIDARMDEAYLDESDITIHVISSISRIAVP